MTPQGATLTLRCPKWTSFAGHRWFKRITRNKRWVQLVYAVIIANISCLMLAPTVERECAFIR